MLGNAIRCLKTLLLNSLFSSVLLSAVASANPHDDAMAAIRAQDFAKALGILKPLADQGNSSAQQNLGAMYAAGLGVPKNVNLGVQWLSRAAAQNNRVAIYNLAGIYSHVAGLIDYPKATTFYRRAAKDGLVEAQIALANFYQSGTGVPKDARRAYVWFSLAADGNPAQRGSTSHLHDQAASNAGTLFRAMNKTDQQYAGDLLLHCRVSHLQNCD